MRSGLFLTLLMLATASGTHATGASVRFLSKTEAGAALTGGDQQEYYGQLQLAEMRAKTGLALEEVSLDAARVAARKAYGSSTEDFTDGERAALQEAVDSMQPILVEKAPLYGRTPWCFIKVNATIEGGLPHTRGDCIVLAVGVLHALTEAHDKGKFDHPSQLWDLLLHEQAHVLERRNPVLFAGLFTEVFGFRQVKVTPPEWLRLRRVINPDAPVVEWIYPIGKGATRHWVLADIELSELEHPHMPADFKIVALAVHENSNHRWVIDDATIPAAQTDLESVADYVDAFPVKGEAFHPNEIAAEMLAELIVGAHMQNPAHELWVPMKRWADKALR